MPFQPRHKDLDLYRSLAIGAFTEMQTQRLPGMKRDLTPEERTSLAQLRGAVQMLNNLGAIDRKWLDLHTKDDGQDVNRR
jgi:hypothetical protein